MPNPLLALWRRRLRRLERDFAREQDSLARRLAGAFGLPGVPDAAALNERLSPLALGRSRSLVERPDYWAFTSGTTAEPRKLPVTKRLLRESRSAMALQLACIADSLGTVSIFRGKQLFITASKPLELQPDGVPAGYITSIAAAALPRWLGRSVIPGSALDAVPTWREKMERLVPLALREDVRVVSGLPPWILSFAEAVEAATGERDVRRLWPNLRLACTSGTALAPYRAELAARLGPVEFRELYLATEGVLGVETEPGGGHLPVSDSTFYQFVPLDRLGEGRPVLLKEAAVGPEYALAISNWAGLFGHLVGDTVRFVSTSPPLMRVTGRLFARASLTREDVSVEQLELAVAEARLALALPLREFCVILNAHRPGVAPWYTFVLEPSTASGALPEGPVAEALDAALRGLNTMYRSRREVEPAVLGRPRVAWAAPGAFSAWLSRIGRLGGSSKVPRVLHEIPEEFIASIQYAD